MRSGFFATIFLIVQLASIKLVYLYDYAVCLMSILKKVLSTRRVCPFIHLSV